MFSELLEAYQSPNPADWIGAYRLFPTWIGILFVLVGAVLLLFGGGKAFRIVGGLLAAVAGYLWVPVAVEKFGISAPPQILAMVSAAVLAALGFALPPGGLFFTFGLLGGLLGGQLVGQNDWIIGFLPAFLIVGAVAAVLHRFIGAVAAALAGAWLFCIGMLTALHQAGGFVEAVANQPWGVIVAALLFAIAGSIYQLAVRPSPEEAEKLRQERFRAQQRLKEKKALEERWMKYNSNRDS
jgi:hypothetical protein